MSIKSETDAILNKYQINIKKKYGQNFLINDEIVKGIIEAINSQYNIVEIGAGIGTLSQRLKSKKKVYSFEIDLELKKVLQNIENVNFIYEDYLLNKEEFNDFIIVGNLPYLITNKCLEKFISYSELPKQIIIMIQSEVADKYLFKVSKKDNLPLALIYSYYYNCQELLSVSPECFMPQPNVYSKVIKFEIKENKKNLKLEEIIKVCFLNRRKTIYNNLDNYFKDKEKVKDLLEKAKIDSHKRAEELSLKDFERLVNEIN
ncbi:MAG: 16S rRNA (adenine(1518)-N(6)/adenine(1519)-N(6))-dimethyltransferase RsmA [Bacillales bacterium]|jgi:16S rRNA (adenine1518-N6/adenine1519-N6)-dimethyltransferase|nr:16S rRNA (adenine(1518)-N(6)/adenine(1519)-N(6))-dimethyltransferase RsmA [Bacillales bacterium]